MAAINPLARCKGCNQTIRYIKTPRGKNMPCDPDKILSTFRTLVNEDGEIVSPVLGEPVTGYVSHWSTCPNADKFRV